MVHITMQQSSSLSLSLQIIDPAQLWLPALQGVHPLLFLNSGGASVN